MSSGKKSKSILLNQDGFSLFEVMAAFTIFAVFVTAYVTSENRNISDSIRMQKEILLQQLCENKINELIINPPEFKDSLTLSTKVEDIKHPNCESCAYEIEFRRLEVPDFTVLMKKNEDNDEDDTNAPIQKKIFKEIKKNIERVIWQVIVTVKNKITNESYSISTWLMNNEAKIRINI